jgi:hypothetical protein
MRDGVDTVKINERQNSTTLKLADWQDPRVQLVYRLLCSDEQPPMEDHWEGYAENQTTTFKWPKFEPCSKCGGGGMHYNGEDIMCCQACGGGGSVVARDERGRFLPWEVVNHVEQ